MFKLLQLIFIACLLSMTSVAQVNLTNGLVAYYPFNGNFNDASGNGNHGAGMNGVTYGSDQWGNINNAASFDGINDWISVPASASITPGRQFSIALRFKTNSSALQLLLSKSDYTATSGPNNWQYQVGFNAASVLTNNGLLFSTNHTNSCATASGFASHYSYGNNVLNNQWYCVVVTFSNGLKKVYMNGVLISSTTVTGNPNNTSVDSCVAGTLRMGTWWQNDPRYFSGLMDEVRIWNRAINTQEIDSVCNLITPAPAQTIINKYAAVTSRVGVCSNTFNVDTATGFGVGDTVLVIQMKGATIDSTNTSSFGSILNYNGAGNYEFNVISAVAGNAITLKYNLNKPYDVQTGRVQFVRVPYFQNYTVSQPHTCMPWNGRKGGIVVLNASGTVTLNAPIDVSQRGFRNGNLVYVATTAAPCGKLDYYYANVTNSWGAEKGEGIAELSANRDHGRGPQGNGGGGGNSSNGGGAGGSNAGAGGIGGKETAISLCAPAQPTGGLGGKALTYSNVLNKVFMGGGSGAGHANNNEGGNGAPGGGIVLVLANQIVDNGQTIIANGGDGNGCLGDCWDGQPGGSAGGSVLLHVNSYSGTVPVSVRGGNGASHEANNTAQGANGPGGGGGGGAVWVKGTSVPSQITASLSGGNRGVFINNNDPWGTTDGQAGLSLSGLTVGFPAASDTFRVPVVNLGNDTLVCPGDTIRLNAGNPGSTYLYNTGDTSRILAVKVGGTYSVAVTSPSQCVVRDTIIINNGVNPVVKLGNDTVICPAATITLNGGTFGSGFAYLYSTTATTPSINVTTAGTYSLRVTNLATGCRGRDTIVIAQGFNPVVNLGKDTFICPATTMTLDAGNIGSTYLYNTSATTRTITISTADTYSVRVTNVNKCVGVDTIVIKQGTDPIVNLGPDTSICADSAVTVDAGNPGSTYLYSTGGTTRTHSLIPAGTYSVQVTNPQGCVGRDTIIIAVIPKASVSVITPARTGSTVSFTSNALHAATYLWSFGDGTSSNAGSTMHSYAANGTYTVRLIVTNQCGSDTAIVTIDVSGVGTGNIVVSSEEFSIYPNPASTFMTLDNKSALKMQSINILNSVGAVVLRKDGVAAKKEIVEVRMLPAGIYTIRIQTDGGSFQRRITILK